MSDVVDLPLAGLKLIKPQVFADDRGFFLETYRTEWIDAAFVQDNHSRSVRNTIRGLHFQKGKGQAKLVRVATGKIFDVAVDLRAGSPTFGKWHAEVLDEHTKHILFIPTGFAHGFCVLSEVADVLYKVSSVYDAATETGFAFDDPEVGVAWPIKRPAALLSKRDTSALPLAAIRAELTR